MLEINTVVIGFGGLTCRRTVLNTRPELPSSLSFNDYMTTRSILCFTTNGVNVYQETFRKVSAFSYALWLKIRNTAFTWDTKFYDLFQWAVLKLCNGLMLEKIIDCFVHTSVRVHAILCAVHCVMDCGCAQGLIFYLFVFLSK